MGCSGSHTSAAASLFVGLGWIGLPNLPMGHKKELFALYIILYKPLVGKEGKKWNLSCFRANPTNTKVESYFFKRSCFSG